MENHSKAADDNIARARLIERDEYLAVPRHDCTIGARTQEGQ
jgi:hypothetical protein